MKSCSKQYFAAVCFRMQMLLGFCLSTFYASSQSGKIDSLKRAFLLPKPESEKFRILNDIQWEYTILTQEDSALKYAQQGLEFVQNSKLPLKWTMWQLANLAFFTSERGNYSLSVAYATQELRIAEQLNDSMQISAALNNIASAYAGMNDYRKALDYYFDGKKMGEKNEPGEGAIQSIAETYLKMHMTDSALYYNKIAYHIADTVHDRYEQYMKEFAIRVFGAIYEEKGEDSLALKYYYQFVNDHYQYRQVNGELDRVFLGIARIFRKKNQIDSSIYYAKKALTNAQAYDDLKYIFITSDFLSTLNDSLKNKSEAFYYLKIALAAKDSMMSIEKVRQIQALTFNEQIREKQQAEYEAAEAEKNRMMVIILSIIVVVAGFLIWNRVRQLRLKYKVKLEQREVEHIKAKHEKEMLELEMQALRAQMNPHFIFNCLSSINSFILKSKTDEASKYLTKFSRLIRMVLNNSKQSFISFEDELETLRLYLDMERLRFKNSFDYAFNLSGDIEMENIFVPPLLLQPFAENAIWHGLMHKREKGFLSFDFCIKEKFLTCVIMDNGIGREQAELLKSKSSEKQKSLGLKITTERLSLLNSNSDKQAFFTIEDMKDENGNVSGTGVHLKISYKTLSEL